MTINDLRGIARIYAVVLFDSSRFFQSRVYRKSADVINSLNEYLVYPAGCCSAGVGKNYDSCNSAEAERW